MLAVVLFPLVGIARLQIVQPLVLGALLGDDRFRRGLLVLEEVADPLAKPGELVIAIKACGVNFPDVLTIQDLYQTKPPRPFSPGTEIAGIVDSVGSGVTLFGAGDRVMGAIGHGGLGARPAQVQNLCPTDLEQVARRQTCAEPIVDAHVRPLAGNGRPANEHDRDVILLQAL